MPEAEGRSTLGSSAKQRRHATRHRSSVSAVLALSVTVTLGLGASVSAQNSTAPQGTRSAGEGGKAPPAGRVAPEWELWSLHGQLIPRDEAAQRGLGCIEDGLSRPRCYETRAELDRAEGIASPRMYAARAAAAAKKRSAAKTRARTHARRPRKTARRADHYGSSAYPLIVYQHSGFAGWYVIANSYCQWFNLTSFYNDSVSSVVAGQHTGYMSWDAGGSGEHYPIGAWAQHSYVGSEWNDQASARARVCL